MAKPGPDLPPASQILALADENGQLPVRVTPGARREALEILDGRLAAKVRAEPEGGKANDAMRKLLARALSIAPSRIVLQRGATPRDKVFRIGC